MLERNNERVLLEYRQHILAAREQVFPLLCPKREKDWLCDWDYVMVNSASGHNEKDCIFTTQHPGQEETLWYTTIYDADAYEVEFIRFTPGYMAVRINIWLATNAQNSCDVYIKYLYTALGNKGKHFIETSARHSFEHSMEWWEKAMNHYIATGECLGR